MTSESNPRAKAAEKKESPENPAPPPAEVKAAHQEKREEEVKREAEQETAEEKPAVLAEQLASRREETRTISREELAEQLHVSTPVSEADPLQALALTSLEQEELNLQEHVAHNPVDAHAPVWLPRQPNSP